VDDESTYLGSTSSGKLFMAVEDVSRLTYYGDGANLFALALTRSDPDGVDAALSRIEYATRDLATGGFAAYSDKESTLQTVRILELLLRAMVAIVGLVGAAGIANTLVLNVTERRREIGILRAIGAGRGHLLRLLLAEGLALGGLGLGLGAALGVALARALVGLTGASLFALDFVLTPGIALATAALALGLALVASVGPGLLAARLRPIEALRYE
jgi:putative ABC transport system permease protein